VSSDSLYASPTFEPVTTAGTDVDLMTLGLGTNGAPGAPCRAIVLLAAATGNLVITQVSPRDPTSPDKTFDISQLPVGYRWDVQASKIKAATVSGLKLAVLFCLALVFAGCTPSQIQIVNGAISIAGQVCTGVVIASGDPALAPICATGEEVAQAIAQLVEQAKKSGTLETALAPVSNKDLYQQIVANRAAAKAGVK
jgi:hypothetical protein